MSGLILNFCQLLQVCSMEVSEGMIRGLRAGVGVAAEVLYRDRVRVRAYLSALSAKWVSNNIMQPAGCK